MEQDKCFFCQTQNQVEQCDKCPMIYCAKHQVIHKPEKLNRCLPFVVDFVENVGRVLRAAKIIKKGEVVMFDGAFTMGPIMMPGCLGCLQTLKADHISCPMCTLPICSSDCDMLNQHLSQECKILAEANLPPLQIDLEQPNSMYNCIGLMRMLLRMKKNDEEGDIYGVNLLMDHYEEREEDADLDQAITETAKFLTKICKLDFVTADKAKRAFGILQTNSVGLAPHGRALYPVVSIMSHSCVPNLTSMLNPGEAIAFRANRVMEKGEELSIRYYDWMESKLCIRREIKKKWLFDCTCPRCASANDLNTYISSPKCPQCQKGLLIPDVPLDHSSPWSCQDCHEKFSVEVINQIEEDVKKLVKDMTTANATVEAMIDEVGRIVGPNYHVILKLKLDVIIEGKGPNIPEEIVVQYCKDLLPIITTLDGDLSHIKGKVALKLAQTQCEIYKKQFSQNILSKEEFFKNIKPYFQLQVEAKKLLQF